MGITPLGMVGSASGADAARATPPVSSGKPHFAAAIEELLGGANAQQLQADQAVQNLVTGRADNLHDVMLAVAKADLSFRAVLEVRNRLVEAYQEVMRMQV